MQILNKLNIDNIIELKKDDSFNYIYDLSINNIQELKNKCNSVDCHLFLYPYSRKVSSADFQFLPYEEYSRDISKEHRSIYTKIVENSGKLFGITLGFVITLVFAIFYPQGLVSIEAIVSVFGAYTIGKEIWNDIENFLINRTKRLKIKIVESYYSYKLDKNNTLTKYSNLAKRYRYDKSVIVPQKMDFIELSNSQTVRMFFQMDDLKDFKDDFARVLSIHLKKTKIEEFDFKGYMIGIKLSLNRNYLGIKRSIELFQSLNFKAFGCLDEDEIWHDNAIFYRKTFSIGKLKYFWKKGIIEEKIMIDKNF